MDLSRSMVQALLDVRQLLARDPDAMHGSGVGGESFAVPVKGEGGLGGELARGAADARRVYNRASCSNAVMVAVAWGQAPAKRKKND